MNTTTYHTNPYFDPEPLLFFASLKILAVINVLVTGICLYTIAFKSPVFMSRVFIGLMVYHFSIASFLVESLSVLAVPIIYLPYIAIKFVGPLSSLGLSPILQLIYHINLLLITGCTAIPLFYYRMDSILPPGHFLNSKCLRYSIYILVYGVLNIFPAPAIYIAWIYQDNFEIKQAVFRTLGVYFEDFMSDSIIATSLGDQNPITTTILSLGIGICSLGIAIVLISSYVIWQFTSKVGVIGSVRYKIQQRQLFLSLVIMTSVFLTVMVIILPGMLFLLMFSSYRTDLINLLEFLGLTSIPLAISSYVFTYKPYRRFIFGLFIKKEKKVLPMRVSSPFMVSKAVFNFTGQR